MPSADGVHYQVPFGHLRHDLHGFRQSFGVYAKMLHGI